jgi:hypothetical protein
MTHPTEDNLNFADIRAEQWRQYHFKDYRKLIKSPVALHVSKNGHRVLDADGFSHYIPYGWYDLTWRVEDGERPFIGFGPDAQEKFNMECK